MNAGPDMKAIVANIANSRRYSHCRLCLKSIEDDYVRFGDGVALDIQDDEQHLRPLSDILTKLLGPEITDEIPGVDAICTECVTDALQASRFVYNCERSTRQLGGVLDNLLQTLDVDLEVYDDQSLYVVVEDNQTELIFMRKEDRWNIERKACSECSNGYQNQGWCKKCKRNQEQFTCEGCSVSFDSAEELKHHDCTKRLKCKDCNQYRSTEKALTEHYVRTHKVHICKECGKSCHGSVRLITHEEKHFNKSKCPSCGKSYATRDFYLKHVRLCENGLLDPHPIRTKLHRPYVCQECGKSYSTTGGLRVHTKFEHGDGKPHICPHCDKKFTAPSYLKVHMVTHTKEKNFVCSICSNRFVSKEALLYHTRRHTGEKPYQCEHCLERFVNASARAEHIKYKHVGPTLMCEICSRKFVTSHFLKMHIKRHHNKDQDAILGM